MSDPTIRFLSGAQPADRQAVVDQFLHGIRVRRPTAASAALEPNHRVSFSLERTDLTGRRRPTTTIGETPGSSITVAGVLGLIAPAVLSPTVSGARPEVTS